MAKLYDLAVKTGSYTNAQGEEKNRYQNIGAVMSSDNGGKFILMHKWFNPAGVPDERGGDSIIVSMFEPKPRQQNGQAPAQPPQQQPAVAKTFDDDIPF
jgi:hypothetical protein